MTHDIHHAHLIKELTEQFKPVFENSPQGIYLYLDDTHKSCNQKFADLLGYSSIKEWVANEFPVEDVAEIDRNRIINAYGEASEKFVASKNTVSIVKKDGKKINVEVIMAPISYQGEIFVLHFITEK